MGHREIIGGERMMKRILSMIIVAVLIIGGLYYTTNKHKDTDNPVQPKEEINQSQIYTLISQENNGILEVGKEVPNFTWQDGEGKQFSLEDYRGKIVLINFWTTWCTYCDKEMPDLQQIYNENEENDFVVLAVDVKEDKKIVEEYIKKGGYTFPVIIDEKGSLSEAFLVGGFPTSYFIAKDGTLVGRVPGMMTYNQMNEILEDIREKF
jgi:thiol-disulfide isomerase/thioredoxin